MNIATLLLKRIVGISKLNKLFLVFVVLWLPALLDSQVVMRAAALYPQINTQQPYFIAEHAGLLYVWSPLVVISALVLLLTPGLILGLLVRVENIGEWILYGFTLNLVVLSSVTAITQQILNHPLTGRSFLILIVILSILSYILLRWLSRGKKISWPFDRAYSRSTLISMVLVPLFLLILLTPKFYWENFNGDGVHAFETARLLLVQPLPFWGSSTANIATFPGISSFLFIYPGSWLIHVFGNIEASARLPYLIYLVVLYAGILSLVEYHKKSALSSSGRWLLWLGLVGYTLAMAYSATYNPYSADLALPATQDTLFMVCLLGYMLSFLQNRRIWSILLLFFTMLASPNGLLLVVFWILAVTVLMRPFPKRRVKESVIGVFSFLLLSILATPILSLLNLPTLGREYGLVNLLSRFAFLQWADWRRFFYLVLPGGILPALSLLLWKRQDQEAKALSIVTLLYFFTFYFQAYTSLHYYVPVMLLPLVIFWRFEFVRERILRPTGLAIVVIFGIVAILLSLPRDFAIDNSGRLVGYSIENRVEGYESSDLNSFQSSQLLYEIFPVDWDPKVPQESYGGSALVWNYYAHNKSETTQQPNYVIQNLSDPAPDFMTLIASQDKFGLYVQNLSFIDDQQDMRPPSPPGSPYYLVPRGMLFRSVPLDEGPQIINLVEVLENMGVDVSSILIRVGMMS